jgi:hypothetical protein
MDVFGVHQQLLADYQAFTAGFTKIHDPRIREHVDQRVANGDQWPDAYLSLNPNFASGGSISELVKQGILHTECERIFRIGKEEPPGSPGQVIDLHQHQRDAVEIARGGASYVLTTGTGSGKSLSYIVPIVDSVLRQRAAGSYHPGVKAIIVYPMNALANSQRHELTKFLKRGYPDGGEPVTFERYTGQDREADRAGILNNPPDILLTNYVMLELLLTRPAERESLITAAQGLRFLVLDELHTYRGRQGADVAMLVRRLRDACTATEDLLAGSSIGTEDLLAGSSIGTEDLLAGSSIGTEDLRAGSSIGTEQIPMQCVGTSATMASPNLRRVPLLIMGLTCWKFPDTPGNCNQ